MKKIYFITSNSGKLQEVKIRFSGIGIEGIGKNIGYPEIQADSLREVAEYGVGVVKNKIDKPFILEDAGLFIDKLHGFPGVYSSYVYKTIGLNGILELLKDKNNRTAFFRSVFAYCAPNEMPRFFEGECKGKISFEKKGSYGFGYDPIFVPGNQKRTFAEMSPERKNKYSHRGKSLNKLLEYLDK